MNAVAQLQAENSRLWAALIYLLLANAVAIGCAASAVIALTNQRARKIAGRVFG